MFNFFLGMCNTINVREHKERQRRKKDTLRLKKLQAKLTPDDPPSSIGSGGQESEPETTAQQWEHAQQANYFDQFFSPQAPSVPSYLGGGSFDHFSLMIYGEPTMPPPPGGSMFGDAPNSSFGAAGFLGMPSPPSFPPP
jgi:hypothetical protein